MVTQQNPVLTLRYGGVEFALIPSGGGGGGGQAIFEQLSSAVQAGGGEDGGGGGGGTTGGAHDEKQQQQAPAGVLWRLVNFTGTLRVVPAQAVVESAAAAPDIEAAAAAVLGTLSPHRGESAEMHVSKARVPVVSSTKGERKAAAGGGGGDLPNGNKKASLSSASASSSTNKPKKKQRQTSIVAFATGATNSSKRSAPATAAAAERRSDGIDGVDESGEQPRAKKSRALVTSDVKNHSEEGQKEDGKSSSPDLAGAVLSGKENNESAAPKEEDDNVEQEDSQLTLLGQDEISYPPLSQETATTSSASHSATTARGLLMVAAASSSSAAAATKDEDATCSHARSNNMGTIQHIMDTAQSQATDTGLWTDEGDESNRSFPTQEEMKDELEADVGDKAGSLVLERVHDESPEGFRSPTDMPLSQASPPGTESTGSAVDEAAATGVPAASEVDIPRVSLGDTPQKGRTHADSAEPVEVPTIMALPETNTTPPPQPTAPCPRWGHTLTSIGNDKLVLYGGQTLVAADSGAIPTTLNDVMVYDTAEKTWFQPYNCQALHRQWHTSTYVPDRQIMVAFGGESCTVSKRTPGKPGKVKTSDVLTVLDTDLMLWYPPAVTGDVPSGRSGHTATLVDKTNIVVFGGVKGSKWINTLYVLDVDRWNWTQPKVQGVPPKPRSYHTATAISDHRIVVFGGNDAECSFNSVHVLQQVVDDDEDEEESVDRENVDANRTDSPRSADPREEREDKDGSRVAAVAIPAPHGGGTRTCWRWTNPTCRGTMPSPRTGHTATLLNDQRTICVFGGWDPNAEEGTGDQPMVVGEDDDSHMFSNDAGCCYLLDTLTWTWRKGGSVRYASDLPLSAVHSGEDGGCQRAGHSAAALTGEGDQVLVFGGRVPGDRFAGDFQRLSGF